MQKGVEIVEKDLNIKTAVDILGITPTHLYRLCAEGKVPYCKIGSAIRFLPSQLEKFMLGEWTPRALRRGPGRQIKDYGHVEELIERGPVIH